MAEAKEAPAPVVPPPDYLERYDWHATIRTALTRDPSELAHALLLHGAPGLGKRAFAWALAQRLLCTAPKDDRGCGNCPGCRRFAAGTHPDLLRVAPLGDSRAIVVDQVRDVRRFVALRPHTAPRKLVLLDPADAMNVSAANALLKILEEPPPGSSLLLVSDQPTRLPATIRSRCTPIPFRAPAVADASRWLRAQGIDEVIAARALELAGGAPLLGRAFARSGELGDRDEWLKDVEALRAGQEDPLRCASRWKRYGAARCLGWFQRYLADVIRSEMENTTTRIKYQSLKDLFNYFDVLCEARVLSRESLDESLLLEDISIRWSRLFVASA